MSSRQGTAAAALGSAPATESLTQDERPALPARRVDYLFGVSGLGNAAADLILETSAALPDWTIDP